MEIGRGVGRVVASAIGSASRRVWISSPWIGPGYVSMLVDRALAGVDVRVVTMDLPDNAGRDLARAADLYGSDKLREAGAKIAYWRRRHNSSRIAALRDAALLTLLALASVLVAGRLAQYSQLLYLVAATLAAVAAAVAVYRLRASRRAEAELLAAEAEFERLSRELATSREAIRRNLKALVVPPAAAFVHAKLYIVDGKAWASSANLTDSGVEKNVELLVEVDVAEAERAFEQLWSTLAAELSRLS
ncbi:MAG: phospholipase D-like domain-containing protein [Thermoproteus sp.]